MIRWDHCRKFDETLVFIPKQKLHSYAHKFVYILNRNSEIIIFWCWFVLHRQYLFENIIKMIMRKTLGSFISLGLCKYFDIFPRYFQIFFYHSIYDESRMIFNIAKSSSRSFPSFNRPSFDTAYLIFMTWKIYYFSILFFAGWKRGKNITDSSFDRKRFSFCNFSLDVPFCSLLWKINFDRRSLID